MKRLFAYALAAALFALTGSAQEAHKMGEPGLTAPKLIYKTDPSYTEEAKAAKVEGSVVLSLEVTDTGTAENIKVTKSLDAGLDMKAIDAVKNWRFAPGEKDKKPVRVQAVIEVNFRLL